jgi:hypothetical protein
MPGIRVYELAHEYGVESKVVLAVLKDIGEFLRSASSPVSPPVAARLRERLGQLPAQPALGTTVRRVAANPVVRPTRLSPDDDFGTAVARAKRTTRSRKHRGPIPPMTQVFLDHYYPGSNPPWEDEVQNAERSAGCWLEAGWLTPAQVRDWLRHCPNVDPGVAVAFLVAGVSPKLAATRLWYGKVLSDRPALFVRVQLGDLTVDGATAQLKQAGMLAA